MSDRRTDYGFTYGPAEVVRLTEYRGSRFLAIDTEHDRIQIRISPKGHRLRVWRLKDDQYTELLEEE